MQYIIKDKDLELKYQPGKGAWTYHIEIPNTKHLMGKWGELKVAGYIDTYKLESKNLSTFKEKDKLISINSEIRTSIGKTGGDTVRVSLYLLSPKEEIKETQILETFKESEVFDVFKKLSPEEQNKILEHIISKKTEEKQIRMIVHYIKLWQEV